MSLKIYKWERRQFPWQWNVDIKLEHRVVLAAALAKHWKLGWVEVRLSTRGGGFAHNGTFNSVIQLPTSKYSCPLAIIVHELAHVYDYRNFKGNGHRASFKRSLIKLMCEVRSLRLLVPAFAQIRDNRTRKNLAMAKAITSGEKKSRRIERAREKSRQQRQEPSRMLLKAQDRVKRLAAKARRTKTALRKARRAVAVLKKKITEVSHGQENQSRDQHDARTMGLVSGSTLLDG